MKENPQAVADFRAGKEKALNSRVGVVMKKNLETRNILLNIILLMVHMVKECL
ncbi:MAG: hypothetical protein O8C61_11700 [Candidatus Methanoperedens sp.]|nr:hypothetical protein [Candidatus Methanoperedens sp.]